MSAYILLVFCVPGIWAPGRDGDGEDGATGRNNDRGLVKKGRRPAFKLRALTLGFLIGRARKIRYNELDKGDLLGKEKLDLSVIWFNNPWRKEITLEPSKKANRKCAALEFVTYLEAHGFSTEFLGHQGLAELLLVFTSNINLSHRFNLD